MPNDDHLASLRLVPLFARCSRRQLEDVVRLADEVILPAGRVLMEEGGSGVELFVVLEGTAGVSRGGRKVATVGPGHFVGEMAVLGDVPRNATVTADSPLRVLVLTRRNLDRLLDDVPGLAKQLLYEVASRVPTTS